jgi:hypothetical protein
MAKTSSSNLPLLLLLLAILAGAGTWNYQRNLKLEAATPRPFGSYSLSDLEALQAAYQGEVDRHTARYRKASGEKVAVRGGGYIGAQVEEFERVQKISQGKRAIASDFAKNQVRLDSVMEEVTLRANQGEPWEQFLARVTKYP